MQGRTGAFRTLNVCCEPFTPCYLRCECLPGVFGRERLILRSKCGQDGKGAVEINADKYVGFVVLVAWSNSDKAYSIVGLDEMRKAVAIETVFVGPASQNELLRQWAQDVTDRLEPGQQAIVLTNHLATMTSRHIKDYPRLTVGYGRRHGANYSAGLQAAMIAAEKGDGN